MRDEAEVRVNDVGDILYVGFGDAAVASCRAFSDLRNVDYDGEGRVVGVELIGLPGGVSLHGLPEAARVREALLRHGPPELRIDEHDSVFHPARGGDARRSARSA